MLKSGGGGVEQTAAKKFASGEITGRFVEILLTMQYQNSQYCFRSKIDKSAFPLNVFFVKPMRCCAQQ
jgi:hypothetical protein